MFWAYNTNSPQIDIILCKEDLTLQELLDQENVLQELKAQNLKLIEFLLKPEILGELITLIITEPSSDLDEAEQYKYPNLACELLTSDLPALNERLATEEILDKLYGFLQNDPPLNPLLSSYFSRTLSILISRKSEQNWYSYQYTCLQALEFLKAKEEFMELLFKHMGTSSIMDLVHNLVTLVEGPELKQSLRCWLQNQNVIPSLVGLLSPNIDADCQINAASALCSIIQKLRDNVADLNEKPESDPILTLLESPQTVELILNTSFGCEKKSETSIESAIEVLITLMQPYLPSESDCRQLLHYSVHDKLESGLTAHNSFIDPHPVKSSPIDAPADIIYAILPYIKKMKGILQNPIKTEPITLTSGTISPPFGKARLVVVKFVAVLISLNNAAINKEIILCDIPELLLDLFYAYSSNNFLHTEVEKLISYAIDNLNGYTVTDNNDDLIFVHLLKKCNLLRRMMDMWNENEERENEGKYRRAYMGHVIRIASFIHIEAQISDCHDLLHKEVPEDCLKDWNTFVNNNLKLIIELHSSCLGGVRPKSCQSSDNSFEDSSYKEPKSLFKEFDPDDDQNVIFSNDTSDLTYGQQNDVIEDEHERQSEMFNVICSQKWPSFVEGLDDIDENESEEKDRMNVWKNDGYIRIWGSDDEGGGDEDRENTSDPWSKLGEVSDPWSESSNKSDNAVWKSDADWANFDDNFGAASGGGAESAASNGESSSTSGGSGGGSVSGGGADAYTLFGNSMPGKTAMLNNFSTLKLDDGQPIRFAGPSAGSVNGGEWNDDGGVEWRGEAANGGEWSAAKSAENSMAAAAADNGNASFELPARFGCFAGGAEKDHLDEMLDLESICGNTLAEKIANAENDIRSKDAIRRRGFHEQQKEQQQQTLPSNSSAATESSDKNGENGGTAAEGVDKAAIGTCGDRLSPEVAVGGAGGSPPPDCLTENSVDFVTADNNSTSDAESSAEFGEPDSSLELDAEDNDVGERRGDGGDADVADEKVAVGGRGAVAADVVAAPNDRAECAEVLSLNVPKGDSDFAEKRSSAVAVPENAPAATTTAVLTPTPGSLANGDVADGDNDVDCDTKTEEANVCSSTSEQSNQDVSCAVITDPA